jgi:glucosyl-dolichyl phosphate glucuronosyltransferase
VANREHIAVSLIIPTYNRAVSLKRALQSAVNLDYPPERYEILVVDNGCTDATPEVVQEAQQNKPGYILNYVREDRLGLHNARHAGVWAAQGNILLFTDDDATFASGWLRAYMDAFEKHPEMAAAGGPVRPCWEVPPPEWLLEFMGDGQTFGLLSLMEPHREFRLDPGGMFFGVNMAIRASILKEVGGFNPEAFGELWLGDGESGLIYKLWNGKRLIGYVPEALVYHHIPPDRATPQYLRRRIANQGACDLYSEIQRTRPNYISLLKRAGALFFRAGQAWIAALRVRDHNDVHSLKLQLEADRTRAQLKYALKLAVSSNLRGFVLKTDWLNDLCPLNQSSRAIHIDKRG